MLKVHIIVTLKEGGDFTKMPAKKKRATKKYTQSFKPTSRKELNIHPREIAGQEVIAAGFTIVAIIFFTYMYRLYA